MPRLNRYLPIARAYSSSTSSKYDGKDVDLVTHTGQIWDKDDLRRGRFVNRTRLVNTRFAIDLIAEDPVVVVDTNHVWSNSGGALGHPKVYINLDKPEVGVCGYSGRKFIQRKYYNEKEHGHSITYEDYLTQMKS